MALGCGPRYLTPGHGGARHSLSHTAPVGYVTGGGFVRQTRPPIPDHLRAEYEERAAMMEYHGGLPRAEAEARAYEIVCGHLIRWQPSNMTGQQRGLFALD